MKKQFFSLLTLFGVLLNITACSSDNSTQQSTDSAANNAADSSQTSEPVSQPESSSSTSTSSSTEKKAYYDDVFKDLVEEIPGTGAPMTYDDVMDVMTNPMHGGLDSYYLVEAIKPLTLKECELLRGFEDWFYKSFAVKYDEIKSKNYDYYGGKTIYKVRLTEDLISGEELNDEVFIDLSDGNPITQKAGNPPYAPGEKFTVALFNKAEGSDITRSGAGYFFKFDIREIDGKLTAFIRENSNFAQSALIEIETISTHEITSTTANPVRYSAKFDFSEFVNFLRADWRERSVKI